MTKSARLPVFAFVAIVFAASGVAAQVISQPTPAPLVTADSEGWYLNGEPITYAGNLYYPAGAQIAFNPNEMFRSGFHLGVPLYSRSTDEPYSLVYVPLARGFVHPYARRRIGDVAGTAGTTPLTGAAAAYSPIGMTERIYQAAGPPTFVAGAPSDAAGLPLGVIPAAPSSERALVSTSGAAIQQAPEIERAAAVPTHTRIGPPPKGINAVFVEFREARWYALGETVPIDPTRMTQVGDLRGFPVYADRDAPEQRIYVAISTGASLVAAYRR